MASVKNLIIATIVIAIVLQQTLATEFLVGDNTGWTNSGFDYQAWANGKDFRVGDKLIFKYTEGVHNVYKVDETGFKNCVPAANSTLLKSGNDTVTLAAPGKKWYICGVGKHCELGKQKLAITVLDETAAPSPSILAPPPSAATTVTASKFYFIFAAVFTVFWAITV